MYLCVRGQRSCICVLGVLILPLSSILIFDFGIIPTVRFFFFILLVNRFKYCVQLLYQVTFLAAPLHGYSINWDHAHGDDQFVLVTFISCLVSCGVEHLVMFLHGHHDTSSSSTRTIRNYSKVIPCYQAIFFFTKNCFLH